MALRLWVDSSEGQVDAWASVVVLFSHLMLVETERQINKDVFYIFMSNIYVLTFTQDDFYEFLFVFSEPRFNFILLNNISKLCFIQYSV